MKEPILTGKALEEFNGWIEINHNETALGAHYSGGIAWLSDCIWELPELIQLAYIQEWLDSVDVHLNVTHTYEGFEYTFGFTCFEVSDYKSYKTRTEALKAAIIKANELYNNRQIR